MNLFKKFPSLIQPMDARKIRFYCYGLGGFYILLCLINYWTYPLAQAPQMDAKENLVWAAWFKANHIPGEPLYRAILYPFVLSQFEPDQWRPLMGLVFGFLLHLGNSYLVGRLSFQLWKSRNAKLIATLLYALNPASIFYAFQLLDITLSIFFCLLAILIAMNAKDRDIRLALTGIVIGLAVLVRPNFLFVGLVLPIAMMIYLESMSTNLIKVWFGFAVVLCAQGLLNYSLSGTFRVLPWQGAYNLYAANKDSSNGLYFQQSIDTSQKKLHENPAKEESIFLYGLEHPDEKQPYDIGEMNDYWYGQFFQRLLVHPLEVFKLWGFKAYAVANSFEQYNNFTFSYHKARLPYLKYNFLNWGILFVLAAISFAWIVRRIPESASAILLIFFSYAVSLIIFYASGRLRLPLVPFLAIMGGGILFPLREMAKKFPVWHRDQYILLSVGLLSVLITFSSFGEVRSKRTYIQDEILMANAYAETSNDYEAIRLAKTVLEKDPNRMEAQQIYAISYLNLKMIKDRRVDEFGDWNEQKEFITNSEFSDKKMLITLAFFYWHWGRSDEAISLWLATQDTSTLKDPNFSNYALVALRHPDRTFKKMDIEILDRIHEMIYLPALSRFE